MATCVPPPGDFDLAFRPHAVCIGGEALVTADIPHARGQEPIAAGTPVALSVPASELRFVSA